MDPLHDPKMRWLWSRDSGLDWDQNSLGVGVKPRRSRCLCGDRKNLRRLVAHFTRHASMHGTHYICSRDSSISTFKRIFYRVFITLCLLACLSSVVWLAQESLGSESVLIATTSKDSITGPEEDPNFPIHPDIMICRTNPFRTDLNSSLQQLVEYASLSLNFPFITLTPEERSLMILSSIHRRRKVDYPSDPVSQKLADQKRRYDDLKNSSEDFNITHLLVENSVRCEDVFVRCIAFVFFFDCCKYFRPVLTGIGMCYFLPSSAKIVKIESQSKFLGFAFTFDLHPVPVPNKSLEVGYHVHIRDPHEVINHIGVDGQYLMNGFTTYVRTKLIKTQRTGLYTPWHGFYDLCPATSPELETQEPERRYSGNYCRQLYLNKLLRDKCHCQYFLNVGYHSLPACDPFDLYNCFVIEAAKDNLSSMADYCPDPCIEYTYESKASYIALGGSQHFSRLIFRYEGEQYIYNEYKTTTFSSFLSQIGGALGLYLGASIVTVLELALFVASWLWYRFMPTWRVADRLF